jgi:TPR repeat protein
MPKNAPPSISASPDAPPPATAPTAVAPTAVTPPSEPRASTAETAALLARGDALFGVGDVSSARLFYERAADAGDGQAALRLGETYDPTFLERAKLRAVQGDAAAAIFWYRRARELGVAEAEILLKGIQTK